MDPFTSWAVGRGGYFTRAEANDYGYRDGEIRQAVRDDVWVKLRHGYYAIAEHVRGLDPVERHNLLSRAVLHRLGPEYTLVGASACAAQHIELMQSDLGDVHVARLGNRHSGRREAGIHIHELPFDPSEDVTMIGEVSALRAPLAVWHASCGLATESALVCMNSALHRGAADREALDDAMPGFLSWAGSRTARLAYRLTDSRIETVGESRTMYLCWEHHLPRPEPQFEVVDVDGVAVARTDFAWELYRHICEFDGKVKYLRYARPGESVSDVVLREKRREDLIRAALWGLTRLIWIDLERARRARTARELRRALEQSRRLYARNATVIAS